MPPVMDPTTDTKSPRSPKNHQGIFQKHIIWHKASGILLVYLEEPISKAGVFRKQDCGEWVYNMYEFIQDGSYKRVSPGKQTCLSDFVNSTSGRTSNSNYHKEKLVCSLFWSDSEHNCIGVQDGCLCSHSSHDWKDVEFFWNDLQPLTPAKRSRPRDDDLEREDAFDLDLSGVTDSLHPPKAMKKESGRDILNNYWSPEELSQPLTPNQEETINLYSNGWDECRSVIDEGPEAILNWFHTQKIHGMKTYDVTDAVYRGYMLQCLRQYEGLTDDKKKWREYILNHKTDLPSEDTIVYQIMLYELVKLQGYTRLILCTGILDRTVVTKIGKELTDPNSEIASHWKLFI